jgi:hypothetical protein
MHLYSARGICIRDGVVQQVTQQLVYASGICEYQNLQRGLCFYAQGEACLRCASLQISRRIVDTLSKIYGRKLIAQASGVG